jgi:hypothetical protein
MADNSAAVHPFRIDIPDGDLTDLRERLSRTRWPERECVPDWTQGIPLDYARELAAYWADGYDWRAREARLNGFDQFITDIDGVDVDGKAYNEQNLFATIFTALGIDPHAEYDLPGMPTFHRVEDKAEPIRDLLA